MAKYNIYAVGRGVDPNTKEYVYGLKFNTWDECKIYVVGIDDAKFKGFLTEDAADMWLDSVVPKKHKKQDMVNDSVNKLELSVAMSEEFKDICMERKVSPKLLVEFLMNKFVEQQAFLKDYS